MHHLLLEFDENNKAVGIVFERHNYSTYVRNATVTKSVLGVTTLPLNAINAIGEALIAQFGDYRLLYRNCQTFAELFVQLICDTDPFEFPSLSVHDIVSAALVAFPLTTITGSIVKWKQKQYFRRTRLGVKEALSWQRLVDAEIEEEMEKLVKQEEPRMSNHKCNLM